MKTNAELAAYIRSGMGGSTPRPEITGVDLRDLLYFIRLSSLEGKQKVIDLRRIERDLKAAGTWDDLDTPLPAPEIRDAKVEKINETTYRVSWKTDQPTFVAVEYGPSDYYGLISPIQGEGKVFTVTLTNVAANLHVRIRAKNEAGKFTVISGLRPAGTLDDRIPPVISAVGATGIAANTATVTWRTDEPSDSQVEYGTTLSYDSLSSLAPSLVLSHGVDLTGLARLTTYHYRVKSKDAAGNLSVSGDFTFTTTDRANAPPTVNAGSDQTITLPAAASLKGTVSDDGIPNPPGKTGATWSRVSGPGTVTFVDATKEATTASFSVDGTYVLRLAVSDSALTTNDDLAITVKPAKVGGALRAYFKFDGDVRDSAGTNHGTLLSGTFVSGKRGQALSVNGSAAAARIPDADVLDIGKADLTIAAWVKFTATNQYFDILAKQGAFKSRGYRLGNGGTGPGKIEGYYNDGILEFQTRTPAAVNDGQWHHIATVLNRDAAAESFLYIDGTDRTVRVGSMLSDTFANTMDLEIGTSFVGLLDELCLFDTALSGGDIAKLSGGTACDQLNPSPPASSEALCLQVPLKNRIREVRQDFAIAGSVEVRRPDGTVALSTVAMPERDGTLRITDPALLGNLDATTSYTVSVKPRSHQRKMLRNIVNIKDGVCRALSPSIVGDFNADGKITLADLVRAIKHFQKSDDAIVSEAYAGSRPTIATLVDLLRAVLSRMEDET